MGNNGDDEELDLWNQEARSNIETALTKYLQISQAENFWRFELQQRLRQT